MRYAQLHVAILTAIGTLHPQAFALQSEEADTATESQQPAVALDGKELEEVIVVGIKDTNSIDIDLGLADTQQANSIFDLFKNEPSIDLGGGGASNAKRIYFRGVESSTLNISLDGATQGKNMFQHRGNELGINPEILKVVNVNTSVDASVPAALGGAVQMQTKNAKDFLGSNQAFGSIAKAGYNTNTQSELASFTAYGVFNQDYGIVASVSGVNSENYEDGNNVEMTGTAYEDRNYFLKFSADNLGAHKLALSFNQNSNGGDMQWGRAGSDQSPNVDPSLLEDIESTTTNYTLQHDYSKGRLINLSTNLSFTDVLIDRKDQELEYDNERIGLRFQNVVYFDTGYLKSRASIGLQIEDEKGEGEFFCSPRDGGSDCAVATYAPTSSTNRAVFAQGVTTINNFDLHYGLRFDDYEFETGLGKATDNTVSPNLGVDYRLGDQSRFHANYGAASRMTGAIPFTWMTNIKRDATYSSELKAEESKRYELGYSFHQQSFFSDRDHFRFDVNVFTTELSDFIVSKDINCDDETGVCGSGEGGRTLQDIYNSDQKYTSTGFEIKADYELDGYFASLSYSNIDTDTENDDSGLVTGVNEQLALRRVGGYDRETLVLNTGVEFTNGFSLNYVMTAVAGLDNSQIVRGGYTVHDISSKYRPSSDSSWTFYLAVHNLTDKYYGRHSTIERQGEYRRELGRDVRLSARYEF